jgi:benzoyl-CoA reductase subunit D
MITAGIDCGAKNTKAVVLKDGRIAGKGMVPTGFDPGKAAGDSLSAALEEAGISRGNVRWIVATGSGRSRVPLADRAVDEFTAMAKGAHHVFPNARTAVDVGAEEGRAVTLDETGSTVDVAANEKCASGAGAFVEAMARALGVAVDEMGPLCFKSEKKIPMNAQCAVFAESEVVGLIHANTDPADISKAVHDAIAGRIVSLIRRIGVTGDVALFGGMARNPGFVASLTRQLEVQTLHIPEGPEFGAAVGAAVCAAEDARTPGSTDG